MTNPDPVQVAYDVIEDVMTPAAYDSHHGGYWLSDLPPDLLAQRIVTALRGHLTSEDTCRRLVHARLAHYGYTTEQIAEAEKDPEHTEACQFSIEYGWQCVSDETGEPLHPLQDALDEAAEAVRWTLEQIGAMLGGSNAPLIDATEETP